MAKLKVDKDLICELAELLEKTGLNEIEWSEAGVQVRVARGTGPASYVLPAAAPSPAGAYASGAPAPADAGGDFAGHPGALKSPMVGTVYVADEPGAPPFVKPGDSVTAGQTVLIVEAMKTMNPITAGVSGRVKHILVENQQPVEYGQVLMVIE